MLSFLFRLAALAVVMPAYATPPPSPTLPFCRVAIEQAERAEHLPAGLLAAIFVVESGRRDPVSGLVEPWPWTINAEGIGHVYASKAEAVAAVQVFQATGVRSIDVGCGQVNLLYHPEAFASLDQAFDPQANAAYAGHFLQTLFGQTSTWPLAAAAYHSFTPDLGAEYARKVLAVWGVPQTAARATPAASAPVPGGRVAMLLPVGSSAIQVLRVASAQSVPSARTVEAQSVSAQRVARR